jgi:hypothetical protein
MRSLLISMFLIAACGSSESDSPDDGRPAAPDTSSIPASLSVAGKLEDKDIKEASGLAVSQRRPDLLWTHNDGGSKPRLYAIDLSGNSVGRAKLKDAKNVDWEDIASFTLDDTPYLLVADVGDNTAKRKRVSLYVVEEPDLDADAKPDLTPAWRIDFGFPGGPRDVEAVAVDVENEQVLLLTKRTIPAELYAVPLRPDALESELAVFLGRIDSLPQPTQQDRKFAGKSNNWHWQPTGMDIAPDGSAIAIVTYLPAVYLYRRQGDLLSSLQQPPLRFSLPLKEPESVAFGTDSRSLFLTNEKKHADLLRIDINGDLK